MVGLGVAGTKQISDHPEIWLVENEPPGLGVLVCWHWARTLRAEANDKIIEPIRCNCLQVFIYKDEPDPDAHWEIGHVASLAIESKDSYAEVKDHHAL